MTESTTRRVVLALARKARSDGSLKISEDIPTVAIVTEFRLRLGSLLRAQWSLRGVDGPRLRFAEKDVRIQFRGQCSMGRGTVVEQGARLRCLSRDGVRIGPGVTIGKFSILECTGSLGHLCRGIEIGERSSVGDYAFLGAAGGIVIGSRVLMGQRVSIHSQNHIFSDPDIPIQMQGTTELGVAIEDDCWIGSGVVILDGVRIGHGSVLSAGTIVTKDVPPGSIVGGVPGKVLRSRW